ASQAQASGDPKSELQSANAAGGESVIVLRSGRTGADLTFMAAPYLEWCASAWCATVEALSKMLVAAAAPRAPWYLAMKRLRPTRVMARAEVRPSARRTFISSYLGVVR